MQVIHVIENFNVGGGVNSFVFDLCSYLAKQNVAVTLIGIINKTFDSNPDIANLKSKGVSVECLGAVSKKNALLFKIHKLRKMIIKISKNDWTICNLHLKLSVLMGGIATIGLKKIKCVETYHSLYSHYFFEYKLMRPFIKMYIACSKTAEREFIKRFHPKSSKICYIPNGVNLEELKKFLSKGLKKDKVKAISVGRFTAQKNFYVSVSALSRIRNDDFEYIIYGDGEDKLLLYKAARSNPNIKMPGAVPRNMVISELANASIVIIPSLWEGLSIFMLEALALNCPLMISDVDSLRDVMHEQPLHNERWRACKWGYLVSTNDENAYFEAISHFIANKENINNLKKEIFNISKEYDISFTGNKYLAVYKKVLNITY